MNLDLQAEQVFEQFKDLENEKAHLGLKSQYYSRLQSYILQNKDLGGCFNYSHNYGNR